MTSCPTSKRSGCPISFALDVFGDRWTLLVLRDLMLRGKQRYREFLASDEGIASNILSDRLRRLEEAGMVSRVPDPSDKRQIIYSVTPKGSSVIPVLLELAAWGASNDNDTALPAKFADAFYADRESFYTNPGERIRDMLEEDSKSEQ